MKYILSYLFFSVFFLFSLSSKAQVVDKEVIIEKEKEIKIKPATKNFEKIIPVKPRKDTQSQNYTFTETTFQPELFNLQIDAPQISAEDSTQKEFETEEGSLKGYIKAGGGNYLTTYFQAFLQHQWSENFNWGLDLKHLASRYGAIAKDYSGRSENSAKIYGKYFLNNSAIQADLSYRQNVNRFYGYNPSQIENLDKDTLKRKFQRIFANLHYTNTHSESDFLYDWGLHFVNFQNNANSRELQAGFSGKLIYKTDETIRFSLFSQAFLTKIKIANNEIDRNYFQLKPMVEVNFDKLEIKAAFINMVYDNDTLERKNSFHFYPVFQASYFFSDKFSFYAGIDGGKERVTLSDFTEENPFLTSPIQLLNTNKLSEFYGGFRGNISADFSFDLGASYARYRNLPFYINSLADSARFAILYELDESKLWKLEGQLSYNFAEKYKIKLKGSYYNYSLTLVEQAWHRPDFALKLLSAFAPSKKLLLNLDLLFMSGIQAKNFISDKKMSLAALTDLSIRADYLFFNKFSAFLSLNNIFANTYQRFLYYPNQGFNFLIGLTYAF